MGYHRAGFDVVGVDHKPQPRYPFRFFRGGALETLALILHGMAVRLSDGSKLRIQDVDAIHASPPCQRYSRTRTIWNREHPDLLGSARELLERSGKPWVIENVPGAPMRHPVMLCGTHFGLKVKRHRLFECSEMLLVGKECKHPAPGSFIQTGRPAKEGDWMIVAGHISCVDVAKRAMGIDWMTRDELVQAIPPAYTEYIGRQLIRRIMEM